MISATDITDTYSTDDQPEAFTYAKLKPWHIRVIKIASAPENEDIALVLVNYNMECWAHSPWNTETHTHSPIGQPNNYIAVSYTWGDQTDMRSISINGRVSQIGRNCYSALQSLAKHYAGRFCWVDAICINQGDTVEKGEQVQIMAEIFRQARLVTSMVGPHADDSQFLFETIREFHARNALHEGTTPAILFELMRHQDQEQYQGALMLSLQGAERALQALVAFSSREYFRRLWIVQELTVAAELHIICGDDKISLPMMENFSCYLSFDSFDSLFDESCPNISTRISNLTKEMYIKRRREKHALWSVQGHHAFSRPQFHVLPMWIAVHIRDDYHRSDVLAQHKDVLPDVEAYIGSWSVSYSSLIQRLASWGCSEVRDILYGLVNISSLPEGFPRSTIPRADYTRSILQTAVEAARMADLVQAHEVIDIIESVSLICKAFRLAFDHPDIQSMLLLRRPSAASLLMRENHALVAIWTQKYNLCLHGRYSITLGKRTRPGLYEEADTSSVIYDGEDTSLVVCTPSSRACTNPEDPSLYRRNLVGDQTQETDYLVPFVTHEDQQHSASAIWLVVRERQRGAYEIVGQAFLCETPRRQTPHLTSCTMDVEDLIVLHCVQNHWLELLTAQPPLKQDLGFVNHTVCGTKSSSWLQSISE